MTARLLAVAALALACGCEGIGLRVVAEPGKNQVIRVTSGDRLYFDLEEDVAAGFRWDCTCSDQDVEVTIDHAEPGPRGGAPGVASVRIRIHRGYDGPSAVRFFCRRRREKSPPAREFTITLYKRTGDVAFWE